MRKLLSYTKSLFIGYLALYARTSLAQPTVSVTDSLTPYNDTGLLDIGNKLYILNQENITDPELKAQLDELNVKYNDLQSLVVESQVIDKHYAVLIDSLLSNDSPEATSALIDDLSNNDPKLKDQYTNFIQLRYEERDRYIDGFGEDYKSFFINQPLLSGKSFLDLTVEDGSIEIIEVLLKHGANLEKYNNQPFIKMNVSVDMADSENKSQVKQEFIDIVKKLINIKKFPPNKLVKGEINGTYTSLFHLVANANETKYVEKLLASGINPFIYDSFGKTADQVCGDKATRDIILKAQQEAGLSKKIVASRDYYYQQPKRLLNDSFSLLSKATAVFTATFVVAIGAIKNPKQVARDTYNLIKDNYNSYNEYRAKNFRDKFNNYFKEYALEGLNIDSETIDFEFNKENNGCSFSHNLSRKYVNTDNKLYIKDWKIGGLKLGNEFRKKHSQIAVSNSKIVELLENKTKGIEIKNTINPFKWWQEVRKSAQSLNKSIKEELIKSHNSYKAFVEHKEKNPEKENVGTVPQFDTDNNTRSIKNPLKSKQEKRSSPTKGSNEEKRLIKAALERQEAERKAKEKAEKDAHKLQQQEKAKQKAEEKAKQEAINKLQQKEVFELKPAIEIPSPDLREEPKLKPEKDEVSIDLEKGIEMPKGDNKKKAWVAKHPERNLYNRHYEIPPRFKKKNNAGEPAKQEISDSVNDSVILANSDLKIKTQSKFKELSELIIIMENLPHLHDINKLISSMNNTLNLLEKLSKSDEAYREVYKTEFSDKLNILINYANDSIIFNKNAGHLFEDISKNCKKLLIEENGLEIIEDIQTAKSWANSVSKDTPQIALPFKISEIINAGEQPSKSLWAKDPFSFFGK
jgi:hypothetical protein